MKHTEGDLIKRSDAINAFDDNYVYYKKGIKYVLEQVPSAEPTVIRCKDCIHYDKGENEVDAWECCKRNAHSTQKENYCAWAERREP